MIINGSIPGDPVEVAKVMKDSGRLTADNEVEGTKVDDAKVEEVKTVGEKPSEGKKTAAKKGGRKSAKKVKADESTDVNIDSNSLFND